MRRVCPSEARVLVQEEDVAKETALGAANRTSP